MCVASDYAKTRTHFLPIFERFRDADAVNKLIIQGYVKIFWQLFFRVFLHNLLQLHAGSAKPFN